MTANLTAKGRKLVTIVDPHIKRDNNYWFYKENHDLDYYVKNKDGGEFDGKLIILQLIKLWNQKTYIKHPCKYSSYVAIHNKTT